MQVSELTEARDALKEVIDILDRYNPSPKEAQIDALKAMLEKFCKDSSMQQPIGMPPGIIYTSGGLRCMYCDWYSMSHNIVGLEHSPECIIELGEQLLDSLS